MGAASQLLFARGHGLFGGTCDVCKLTKTVACTTEIRQKEDVTLDGGGNEIKTPAEFDGKPIMRWTVLCEATTTDLKSCLQDAITAGTVSEVPKEPG
jgi:hypothetical protein